MIIVIHHSADFDGIFSREVARDHFGDDAQYLGWDYGDPVPDVPLDADLFLIDISVDALMTHPRLVWIDHHKTAIEKYPAAARTGYCIDGVAACRLAYQYFHNIAWRLTTKEEYLDRRVTEPLAVRLAGEYDVWDKRDMRAEVFQYGLKSCYMDNRWGALLYTGKNPAISPDKEVDAILSFGEGSKGYQENVNAELIKAYSFDVEFEGLTFLALNTARCNSLTFESGIQPHHDGLLGFRYDGKKWAFSLYGVPDKPDVDLSVIASKHGGGGHKQACGFQVQSLPF